MPVRKLSTQSQASNANSGIAGYKRISALDKLGVKMSKNPYSSDFKTEDETVKEHQEKEKYMARFSIMNKHAPLFTQRMKFHIEDEAR